MGEERARERQIKKGRNGAEERERKPGETTLGAQGNAAVVNQSEGLKRRGGNADEATEVPQRVRAAVSLKQVQKEYGRGRRREIEPERAGQSSAEDAAASVSR